MSISLTKGNTVSLAKKDGSALTKVTLGLGWDAAKKGLFGGFLGGDIDLDASALLYDGQGRNTEIVYFGQLKSKDGSVRHSGDNLTGNGNGDDEQIVVDLTRVPADIQHIVFTINSYSGQKFDQVKNVFARVVDSSDRNNTEIVRYNLAESASKTGVVIAKVTRQGSGWAFTAIGEYADGRTANKLVDTARNFL